MRSCLSHANRENNHNNAMAFSHFLCATVLSTVCVHACSGSKLCPTVCEPMDYSPPGSCVHETFEARILEWVAISSLEMEMATHSCILA